MRIAIHIATNPAKWLTYRSFASTACGEPPTHFVSSGDRPRWSLRQQCSDQRNGIIELAFIPLFSTRTGSSLRSRGSGAVFVVLFASRTFSFVCLTALFALLQRHAAKRLSLGLRTSDLMKSRTHGIGRSSKAVSGFEGLSMSWRYDCFIF